MVKKAEGAEGAEGAGGEVFWLGCLIMVNHPDLISLEELTTKGKSPAYKVNHARILLLADTKGEKGGWNDQAISSALKISVATIERVRQRLVEKGLYQFSKTVAYLIEM